MDKKLAQVFRSRWDAVASVKAAEQRTASLALRWKQLSAPYQLGLELGLIQTQRDEETIQQRWSRQR